DGAAPPLESAEAREEPPAPTAFRPLRAADLPPASPPIRLKVARFRLRNGITVLVHANHANPTFALRGTLPGGSAFDPADATGLADVTAGSLRGTRRRRAWDFARETDDRDATLFAYAAPEAVF